MECFEINHVPECYDYDGWLLFYRYSHNDLLQLIKFLSEDDLSLKIKEYNINDPYSINYNKGNFIYLLIKLKMRKKPLTKKFILRCYLSLMKII